MVISSDGCFSAFDIHVHISEYSLHAEIAFRGGPKMYTTSSCVKSSSVHPVLEIFLLGHLRLGVLIALPIFDICSILAFHRIWVRPRDHTPVSRTVLYHKNMTTPTLATGYTWWIRLQVNHDRSYLGFRGWKNCPESQGLIPSPSDNCLAKQGYNTHFKLKSIDWGGKSISYKNFLQNNWCLKIAYNVGFSVYLSIGWNRKI